MISWNTTFSCISKTDATNLTYMNNAITQTVSASTGFVTHEGKRKQPQYLHTGLLGPFIQNH